MEHSSIFKKEPRHLISISDSKNQMRNNELVKNNVTVTVKLQRILCNDDCFANNVSPNLKYACSLPIGSWFWQSYSVTPSTHTHTTLDMPKYNQSLTLYSI